MDRIEWPDLPAAQQPVWPDPVALASALDELRALPPLVFAGECDNLTGRLAAASRGQAFVLMGGDCAETFDTATAEAIRAKLKTVLQMAIVLTYGASLPVVKVGRMAGQYFKPRSSPSEVRDGVALTSYYGDGVNALPFQAAGRVPDPNRLLRSYHTASATLNLVRAFTQGGYADLRQVHAWNQDFVAETAAGHRYDQVAGEIDRALAFMAACGADPEEFKRVEFYAGHEALVLDYEKALTRIDSRTGNPYDVSGHFVWVGERTRQLDGAHIDFAARISNPVGVKLGPTTTPEQAVELAERLNPDRVARAPHVHHADGRGRGARRPAGDRRGGHGVRPPRRVGVRPDARQHPRGRERPQDAVLLRRRGRGARLLPGAQEARHGAGRHPRRAHR